jgi:hypothetical protein
MINKISILSNNEALEERALSLIDHLDIPVEHENPAEFSFRAQYRRMFNYDADIVVGMDMGCFFIRPEAIWLISDYMLRNNVAVMAMREQSGVATHRTNVQNSKPCDYNSFLMFTNTKLLKPHKIEVNELMQKYYSTLWIEPYWMLFRYIADIPTLRVEEFKGYTHADGISTVLTWEDKPFVLHTWYEREFIYIPQSRTNHRDRILSRYQEVKDGNI